MEIENLLPIGSVIRLRDAEKRLMIFGVKQSAASENGPASADYIGVLYPEGNVGPDHQYLFNHEDIDEVVFRGFEDSERDAFISELHGYYSGQANA